MDLIPQLSIGDIAGQQTPWTTGQPATVRTSIIVSSPVAFEVDVALEMWPSERGDPLYRRHCGADGLSIGWLPAGRYDLDWYVPRLNVEPGQYHVRVVLYAKYAGKTIIAAEEILDVPVEGENLTGEPIQAFWYLETQEGPPVSELSWRQGPENWFFRHFDHAATTIISYMLGDSPLLSGKILDVGCGDGITDLGIALRCEPELLVGVDPFRGYERLPNIMKENHLDIEMPDCLKFDDCDGNHLPYPDDTFDVVISWGSVEHIAGGYLQTMREIKRVLRNGGLLFIHPGLYYSNFGHHLGEFSSEPFFHLTKSPDQIKNIVFNTKPKLIDRSGDTATPEDYWRWYNELNPITVAEFETQLRALEFEFYRVALRTEDRIEYSHPRLQKYSMQDLATVELYLSAYNRKQPRPEGFKVEQP